jgi:hypothetical protein
LGQLNWTEGNFQCQAVTKGIKQEFNSVTVREANTLPEMFAISLTVLLLAVSKSLSGECQQYSISCLDIKHSPKYSCQELFEQSTNKKFIRNNQSSIR